MMRPPWRLAWAL